MDMYIEIEQMFLYVLNLDVCKSVHVPHMRTSKCSQNWCMTVPTGADVSRKFYASDMELQKV